MTQTLAPLTVGEHITVRRETAPDARALVQWDRLVERSSGTDVTQLSAWSAVRSLAGFSPIYLLAFQGGTVVGGGLVNCRRVLGMLRVCYLPYGPLIDQSRPDAAMIAASLIRELTRLAHSSAMTFVQPPEGAKIISDGLLANGFRPSHANVAPAGSYRVDLAPPLEEIRRGFSKRLKSWTNRWDVSGVTVRRGDDRDVPMLLELMRETADRHGFEPPSLEQLSAIHSELAPLGHAAIFIGEVDGRAVAADLVTMLGDTVRGRRCGFDSRGGAGRLSVPAAVRWEIIKWAKNGGYRWLDFGGLPEPMLDDMLDRAVRTSDDWPGAHRAKLSFNGEPFRYPPAVELVRPRALRFAYDAARSSTRGQRLIDVAKTAIRVGRVPEFQGSDHRRQR
jgi:lipid II:glycine glycyltransferase (peptidoglycan interpeptide bridge formation enzyme)